jgi:acetyltransferase-like isoleucine patch superfamily enzyme
MRKAMISLLLCTVLCAAVFAQNESGFKTDGKGTITSYEGWDVTVVIPSRIGNENITGIRQTTFKNMGLTSVTIPDSVTSIGNEAFAENKLTSASIPNSVTTIGDKAFSNNQLTSLVLGGNVHIGQNAFSNNQLTSLVLGDKVYIDKNAFVNNPLASLTMGNDCIINNNLFRATNLKEIVLGANIICKESTFGRFVFYDYMCNDRKAGTYNTAVSYNTNNEGGYEFYKTKYGAVIAKYNGNEKDRLIIPEQLGGVTVKGICHNGTDGAFQKKGITRVRLPDSITFITSEAFQGNYLSSITLPEGVVFIGDAAFRDNELTSVTIPASVTLIGNHAFYQNRLKSIIIPNSVILIGAGAFYGNAFLTSATLSDSVIHIDEGAFNVTGLTNITIGGNVTLGKDALPNNFINLYNTNGMKTGVYVLDGRQWNMK